MPGTDLSLPMHKVTKSQNLYIHSAVIQTEEETLRIQHPAKKLAVRLRDEPAQEGNVKTLQTQVTGGRTARREAEAALSE